MTTKNSYKDYFQSKEKASDYDNNQYRPGTYSALLWDLEKPILREIIQQFAENKTNVRYLDFACGSGRVLSFVENLVKTSTGIEISEAMISLAAAKVSSADLRCIDIVEDRAANIGPYDLVTAFRFILNAEPGLRIAAIQRLTELLADQDSRIVFNNHGHSRSIKHLGSVLGISRRSKQDQFEGNSLSPRDVDDLIAQCGLVIERRVGYGILGGRISSWLPGRLALKLEQLFAGTAIANCIGINQLYITRLQSVA